MNSYFILLLIIGESKIMENEVQNEDIFRGVAVE